MKKNLKANIWLWIASALLVIVVAGFLIISRNGREFEVDGICYKVVDDISNIVAVTCKGDSYDTYADEYVGAVVIPDNITYRGINYTVEQIDNEAFRDCSKMTSIIIPPSVWHVGIGAFSGCSGLKEIHISDLSAWCKLSFDDVADDVGGSPLNYAEGLYLNGELITDLIVPEDVEEIYAHTFEGYDKLRSVVFHKDIVYIHKSAFFSCSNLTDVTFEGDVEYIGPYTFEDTPWYDNQPDGEVYIGKLLYKYKGDMPSNTSIVIKDGTELICKSAFNNCKGLTSITFPSSLEAIHNEAFACCDNLKEIYFKASTPPYINGYHHDFHKDVVIYVPKGAREAYRWHTRQFENVVEIDF